MSVIRDFNKICVMVKQIQNKMVKSNKDKLAITSLKKAKDDNRILRRTVKERNAEIVIDNKQLRERRLLIKALESSNTAFRSLIKTLTKGKYFLFKLPPSINILGIKHKVILKPKIISKGKEVWGLAVYSKREIHISKKAPDKFDVLVHEIFHHVGHLLNDSKVDRSELWANTFAVLFTSLYSQINEASSK